MKQVLFIVLAGVNTGGAIMYGFHHKPGWCAFTAAVAVILALFVVTSPARESD
jgi:hypothetical protein